MKSIHTHFIFKFWIIGLVMIFMATNVVWAYTPETNFWAKRQNQRSKKDNVQLTRLPSVFPNSTPISVIKNQSSLDHPLSNNPTTSQTGLPRRQAGLPPILSVLPHQFGSIRNISTGKTGNVVLHLQDIHLNVEAQENLTRLLQHLINSKEKFVIGLEGGIGVFDYDHMRNPDLHQERLDLGNYFLREGKMDAASYVGLTSPTDLPVFVGVDDKEAYLANVKAYRDAAPSAEKRKIQLKKENEELEHEKRQIFSAPLLAFDQVVQKYRQGNLSLGSYLRILSKEHPSLPLSLQTFLAAFELEQKMDPNQLKRERTSLIEALVQKMSPQEIENLKHQTLAFQAAHLSYQQFWTYIKQTCEAHRLSLRFFPTMDDYIRYILLADSIQTDALFKDVKTAEEQVYDSFIQNKEQRSLIKQARHLHLISKLTDFALTSVEWEEYKEPLIDSSNGQLSVVNCQSFVSFYQLAERRNQYLIENLSNEMEKRNIKTGLLIAGGFHSAGMQSLLKKKNWSYAAFTPKITKVDTEKGTAYLGVFNREKSALEKIFQGEKLYLFPGHAIPNEKSAPISSMINLKSLIEAALTAATLPDQIYSHNNRTVSLNRKSPDGLNMNVNGRSIRSLCVHKDQPQKLLTRETKGILNWLNQHTPRWLKVGVEDPLGYAVLGPLLETVLYFVGSSVIGGFGLSLAHVTNAFVPHSSDWAFVAGILVLATAVFTWRHKHKSLRLIVYQFGAGLLFSLFILTPFLAGTISLEHPIVFFQSLRSAPFFLAASQAWGFHSALNVLSARGQRLISPYDRSLTRTDFLRSLMGPVSVFLIYSGLVYGSVVGSLALGLGVFPMMMVLLVTPFMMTLWQIRNEPYASLFFSHLVSNPLPFLFLGLSFFALNNVSGFLSFVLDPAGMASVLLFVFPVLWISLLSATPTMIETDPSDGWGRLFSEMKGYLVIIKMVVTTFLTVWLILFTNLQSVTSTHTWTTKTTWSETDFDQARLKVGSFQKLLIPDPVKEEISDEIRYREWMKETPWKLDVRWIHEGIAKWQKMEISDPNQFVLVAETSCPAEMAEKSQLKLFAYRGRLFIWAGEEHRREGTLQMGGILKTLISTTDGINGRQRPPFENLHAEEYLGAHKNLLTQFEDPARRLPVRMAQKRGVSVYLTPNVVSPHIVHQLTTTSPIGYTTNEVITVTFLKYYQSAVARFITEAKKRNIITGPTTVSDLEDPQIIRATFDVMDGEMADYWDLTKEDLIQIVHQTLHTQWRNWSDEKRTEHVNSLLTEMGMASNQEIKNTLASLYPDISETDEVPTLVALITGGNHFPDITREDVVDDDLTHPMRLESLKRTLPPYAEKTKNQAPNPKFIKSSLFPLGILIALFLLPLFMGGPSSSSSMMALNFPLSFAGSPLVLTVPHSFSFPSLADLLREARRLILRSQQWLKNSLTFMGMESDRESKGKREGPLARFRSKSPEPKSPDNAALGPDDSATDPDNTMLDWDRFINELHYRKAKVLVRQLKRSLQHPKNIPQAKKIIRDFLRKRENNTFYLRYIKTHFNHLVHDNKLVPNETLEFMVSLIWVDGWTNFFDNLPPLAIWMHMDSQKFREEADLFFELTDSKFTPLDIRRLIQNWDVLQLRRAKDIITGLITESRPLSKRAGIIYEILDDELQRHEIRRPDPPPEARESNGITGFDFKGMPAETLYQNGHWNINLIEKLLKRAAELITPAGQPPIRVSIVGGTRYLRASDRKDLDIYLWQEGHALSDETRFQLLDAMDRLLDPFSDCRVDQNPDFLIIEKGGDRNSDLELDLDIYFDEKNSPFETAVEDIGHGIITRTLVLTTVDETETDDESVARDESHAYLATLYYFGENDEHYNEELKAFRAETDPRIFWTSEGRGELRRFLTQSPTDTQQREEAVARRLQEPAHPFEPEAINQHDDSAASQSFETIVEQAIHMVRTDYAHIPNHPQMLSLLESLQAEGGRFHVVDDLPGSFRIQKVETDHDRTEFHILMDRSLAWLVDQPSDFWVTLQLEHRRALIIFFASKLIHETAELMMESSDLVHWENELDPELPHTEAAAVRAELRFLAQVPKFFDHFGSLINENTNAPLFELYRETLGQLDQTLDPTELEEWLNQQNTHIERFLRRINILAENAEVNWNQVQVFENHMVKNENSLVKLERNTTPITAGRNTDASDSKSATTPDEPSDENGNNHVWPLPPGEWENRRDRAQEIMEGTDTKKKDRLRRFLLAFIHVHQPLMLTGHQSSQYSDLSVQEFLDHCIRTILEAKAKSANHWKKAYSKYTMVLNHELFKFTDEERTLYQALVEEIFGYNPDAKLPKKKRAKKSEIQISLEERGGGPTQDTMKEWIAYWIDTYGRFTRSAWTQPQLTHRYRGKDKGSTPRELFIASKIPVRDKQPVEPDLEKFVRNTKTLLPISTVVRDWGVSLAKTKTIYARKFLAEAWKSKKRKIDEKEYKQRNKRAQKIYDEGKDRDFILKLILASLYHISKKKFIPMILAEFPNYNTEEGMTQEEWEMELVFECLKPKRTDEKGKPTYITIWNEEPDFWFRVINESNILNTDVYELDYLRVVSHIFDLDISKKAQRYNIALQTTWVQNRLRDQGVDPDSFEGKVEKGPWMETRVYLLPGFLVAAVLVLLAINGVIPALAVRVGMGIYVAVWSGLVFGIHHNDHKIGKGLIGLLMGLLTFWPFLFGVIDLSSLASVFSSFQTNLLPSNLILAHVLHMVINLVDFFTLTHRDTKPLPYRWGKPTLSETEYQATLQRIDEEFPDDEEIVKSEFDLHWLPWLETWQIQEALDEYKKEAEEEKETKRIPGWILILTGVLLLFVVGIWLGTLVDPPLSPFYTSFLIAIIIGSFLLLIYIHELGHFLVQKGIQLDGLRKGQSVIRNMALRLFSPQWDLSPRVMFNLSFELTMPPRDWVRFSRSGPLADLLLGMISLLLLNISQSKSWESVVTFIFVASLSSFMLNSTIKADGVTTDRFKRIERFSEAFYEHYGGSKVIGCDAKSPGTVKFPDNSFYIRTKNEVYWVKHGNLTETELLEEAEKDTPLKFYSYFIGYLPIPFKLDRELVKTKKGNSTLSFQNETYAVYRVTNFPSELLHPSSREDRFPPVWDILTSFGLEDSGAIEKATVEQYSLDSGFSVRRIDLNQCRGARCQKWNLLRTELRAQTGQVDILYDTNRDPISVFPVLSAKDQELARQRKTLNNTIQNYRLIFEEDARRDEQGLPPNPDYPLDQFYKDTQDTLAVGIRYHGLKEASKDASERYLPLGDYYLYKDETWKEVSEDYFPLYYESKSKLEPPFLRVQYEFSEKGDIEPNNLTIKSIPPNEYDSSVRTLDTVTFEHDLAILPSVYNPNNANMTDLEEYYQSILGFPKVFRDVTRHHENPKEWPIETNGNKSKEQILILGAASGIGLVSVYLAWLQQKGISFEEAFENEDRQPLLHVREINPVAVARLQEVARQLGLSPNSIQIEVGDNLPSTGTYDLVIWAMPRHTIPLAGEQDIGEVLLEEFHSDGPKARKDLELFAQQLPDHLNENGLGIVCNSPTEAVLNILQGKDQPHEGHLTVTRASELYATTKKSNPNTYFLLKGKPVSKKKKGRGRDQAFKPPNLLEKLRDWVRWLLTQNARLDPIFVGSLVLYCVFLYFGDSSSSALAMVGGAVASKKKKRVRRPSFIPAEDWKLMWHGGDWFAIKYKTRQAVVRQFLKFIQRKDKNVKDYSDLGYKHFKKHWPAIGQSLGGLYNKYSRQKRPSGENVIPFMIRKLRLGPAKVKPSSIKTLATLKNRKEAGDFIVNGKIVMPWAEFHPTLEKRIVTAFAKQLGKKPLDLTTKDFRKTFDFIGVGMLGFLNKYNRKMKNNNIPKMARWYLLESLGFFVDDEGQPLHIKTLAEIQTTADLKTLYDQKALVERTPWYLLKIFNSPFIVHSLKELAATKKLFLEHQQRHPDDSDYYPTSDEVDALLPQMTHKDLSRLSTKDPGAYIIPGLGKKLFGLQEHYHQVEKGEDPILYRLLQHAKEFMSIPPIGRAYSLRTVRLLVDLGFIKDNSMVARLPHSAQRSLILEIKRKKDFDFEKLKRINLLTPSPSMGGPLFCFWKRFRTERNLHIRRIKLFKSMGFVWDQDDLQAHARSIRKGLMALKNMDMTFPPSSLRNLIQEGRIDLSPEESRTVRMDLDLALQQADQMMAEKRTSASDKTRLQNWKKGLASYWALLDSIEGLPNRFGIAYYAYQTSDDFDRYPLASPPAEPATIINYIGHQDLGSQDFSPKNLIRQFSFHHNQRQLSVLDHYHLRICRSPLFFLHLLFIEALSVDQTENEPIRTLFESRWLKTILNGVLVTNPTAQLYMVAIRSALNSKFDKVPDPLRSTLYKFRFRNGNNTAHSPTGSMALRTKWAKKKAPNTFKGQIFDIPRMETERYLLPGILWGLITFSGAVQAGINPTIPVAIAMWIYVLFWSGLRFALDHENNRMIKGLLGVLMGVGTFWQVLFGVVDFSSSSILLSLTTLLIFSFSLLLTHLFHVAWQASHILKLQEKPTQNARLDPILFPQPIKNQRNATALARHLPQLTQFRLFLQIMVERRLAKKERILKFGVLGPHTGEEMAGILAMVIIEFDFHSDWGDVTDWDIEVNGLDWGRENVKEARARLKGLRPFVKNSGLYLENDEYRTAVDSIIEALNRDPQWSSNRFHVERGDATKKRNLIKFNDHDAIFMNFVGEVHKKIWPSLLEYGKKAFIFSVQYGDMHEPFLDDADRTIFNEKVNDPHDGDSNYIMVFPKISPKKFKLYLASLASSRRPDFWENPFPKSEKMVLLDLSDVLPHPINEVYEIVVVPLVESLVLAALAMGPGVLAGLWIGAFVPALELGGPVSLMVAWFVFLGVGLTWGRFLAIKVFKLLHDISGRDVGEGPRQAHWISFILSAAVGLLFIIEGFPLSPYASLLALMALQGISYAVVHLLFHMGWNYVQPWKHRMLTLTRRKSQPEDTWLSYRKVDGTAEGFKDDLSDDVKKEFYPRILSDPRVFDRETREQGVQSNKDNYSDIMNQAGSRYEWLNGFVDNSVDATLGRLGFHPSGRFGNEFQSSLATLEDFPSPQSRVQVNTKTEKGPHRELRFRKGKKKRDFETTWTVLKTPRKKGTTMTVTFGTEDGQEPKDKEEERLKEYLEELVEHLHYGFSNNRFIKVYLKIDKGLDIHNPITGKKNADGQRRCLNPLTGVVNSEGKSLEGRHVFKGRVNVFVEKNRVVVEDFGTGVYDEDVVERLLVSKSPHDKEDKEKSKEVLLIEDHPEDKHQFQLELRSESQEIYLKSDLSVMVNGRGHKKIIPKEGRNLPALFKLELPSGTWVPEPRNRVLITEEDVNIFIDKILDFEKDGNGQANTPEVVQERIQILNGLALILTEVQGDQPPTRTSLVELAKNRIASWLDELEENDYVLFPNQGDFFHIEGNGRTPLYLDAMLFDFNPATAPGITPYNIEEADPELIRPFLFDSRPYTLYVVDMHPDSQMISFIYRRSIFVNKKVADPHKIPSPLAAHLNQLPRPAGHATTSVGTFVPRIPPDPTEIRERELVKQHPFIEALRPHPRARLFHFLAAFFLSWQKPWLERLELLFNNLVSPLHWPHLVEDLIRAVTQPTDQQRAPPQPKSIANLGNLNPQEYSSPIVTPLCTYVFDQGRTHLFGSTHSGPQLVMNAEATLLSDPFHSSGTDYVFYFDEQAQQSELYEIQYVKSLNRFRLSL
ncbi:hypothetical protein BVX98_03070 [bacterium F11]|nr:hypothetical protein BVX98_03070 [bacterium F11]